ncbi:MAG: UDP-N-acetylglucosamine 2-epimerase (non-hydrolyzing) [Planctomycetes bacterium]|nr:UDP-N-acetylglucosamine 2-epimerase (non-hydrolyzing) [Planctomycetota bacterium]
MSRAVPPVKALVVLGTRPEAVKLFPVVRALEADGRFEVDLAVTGQHREMVSQILEPFGIRPRFDLDVLRPGQSLNDLSSRVLPRLDALYSEAQPGVVVVQGDTTSAFCAALAAFHRRIPTAHVEAGLRSRDRFHPYPEESNRRMIGAVADLHLAPTAGAAENLLGEGVPRSEIVVTGNTAIDSLLHVVSAGERPEALREAGVELRGDGRVVLVTVHRRESWEGKDGASPLEEILAAVRGAAEEHPLVDFVYPVHRNPKVRDPARRVLGGRGNVHVLEPLPYIPFVSLMARAAAILTDSGGIQEEAPSLGVPVLVLRETTERPEGLECGSNRLVGTRAGPIRDALRRTLEAPPPRAGTIPLPSPFGDGKASERVRAAILHFLGLGGRPDEFLAPPLMGRGGRPVERPGPARPKEHQDQGEPGR